MRNILRKLLYNLESFALIYIFTIRKNRKYASSEPNSYKFIVIYIKFNEILMTEQNSE